MREDPTRLDAQLEADHEEFQRQLEAQKAHIIGSAVELDRVIFQTRKELRLKIMKLVVDLTDAGLELPNPLCHEELPLQTLDMAVELAEHVKAAIEEYVDSD